MARQYKKMSGFATTRGQDFEVNLAALLFLRGLNSGLDFELGTNVKGAGALDDIVFRFKTPAERDWTTLFVQMKHKDRSGVSRNMLTSPKGDFSVPKYFEAFQEIEESMSNSRPPLLDGNFDKCLFVIFTNAKATESLGPERCEYLSQAEEFVKLDSGFIFSFEREADILKCLGDCGDKGGRFLDRLRLFCEQPKPKTLELAIKEELQKVDEKIMKGVYLGSIVDCFLRRTKIWWEKSTEVLCNDHDLLLSSILDAASELTTRECKFSVEFAAAAFIPIRSALESDSKIVNIYYSENSFRLTLTKLLGAIGSQSLVLTCKSLLANKDAILSQFSRTYYVQSLIICTHDWSSENSQEYFAVLAELVSVPVTSSVCKTVLLTEKSRSGKERIELLPECESITDEFIFSQLSEKSRELILDKQINFQGCNVKLSQILSSALEDREGDLDEYLDAASVVDILASVDSLSLGPAMTRGVEYYIDRTLEKATALKSSVFQVGNLQETVTIRVTLGDAGPAIKSFSRLPLVTDDVNKPILVRKAIQFISSLKETKHNHHVLDREVAKKLTQSPMPNKDKPDKDDVFTSSEFKLGSFVCQCVGLRAGKDDAVTALLARTPEEVVEKVRFLFLSDKTDEADAAKLSNYHQSKHFVWLENGQLRWVKSLGDIELIRPHIDQDKITSFAPERVTDVEDRLVLVCAEPGMGKTTLMNRLAKNTKEAHPHYFVILIALNDFAHLFAQNKHQDALVFLSSANKIESHLHLSLLKYALEVSGNVVLLFDGYDEIAPKYVDHLHDLLASLKETKARKIWITSRKSIKLQLENHSSTFSAKLCKFNQEDQKQFLIKFWAKDSILDVAKLGAFIDELLKKTSEAIRDKETNLMGIPLQTRMLAEVYVGHVNGSTLGFKLHDNLDLLALLEQFVEIKFNVYVQLKLRLSSDDPSYDYLWAELREKFFDNHGKAGLILILRKDRSIDVETFVKESSKFFKEIQSSSEKTGFIDYVENEKPHFVHRVFAEYFVAKWMSMHFTDYLELIKSKLFTPAFAVIRNVFEFILAKGCDLHSAVLKDDVMTVQTLLVGQNVDDLLNASDSGERTALHLAASRGTSDDRTENDRRSEILNEVIAKTRDFNHVDKVLRFSPLQYADLSETWVAIDKLLPLTDNKQLSKTSADVINSGMLETIFVFDLSNLLGFCLDEGLSVEHCVDGRRSLLLRACEKDSLKVAALLIERDALINNRDERTGKVSAFSYASNHGHPKIVKLILSKYAKHYQEVKNCVSNYPGYFYKELQTLYWLSRGRAANEQEVVDVLAKKRPSDRDVHVNSTLHIAAFCNQPSALRVLLEVSRSQGTSANMCTSSKKTVLYHGAWGGSLECVKILVEAGGKIKFPSVRGTTPLMVAAEFGHLQVVTYLLSKEPEETKVEYINMTDVAGYSAIHLAAKTGQTDVIRYLIDQGGDFRGRNRKDQTPLHTAAEYRQPGAVKALLEELKKTKGPVVNLAGHVGFTELMCAAWGGCLECVTILASAGGKLSLVNNNKRTALMVAATRHHAPVVRFLLESFDEKKEGMKLFDFVNMVDKDGINALHLAARKCLECVSLLVSAGSKLSQEINGGGTSLIVAASRSSNAPIFLFLLEAFDAKKEGMTLRDFIDKKDENGETAMKVTNTECSNMMKSFLEQTVD